MEESFDIFINHFIQTVAKKAEKLNKILWRLETTGAKDAADLFAKQSHEFKQLFSDKEIYNKLLQWEKNKNQLDEINQRQLTVLILQFKQNMVDKDLLLQISQKEAKLMHLYASFRTKLDGKAFTENQIRESLKTEKSYDKRKEVWKASKEIGNVLAEDIIELVKLRNKAAKSLGYNNYFDMQLALGEVNKEWLFKILEKFHHESKDAYEKMIFDLNQFFCKQFSIDKEKIAPWLWKEPFCQEDPAQDEKVLDDILKKLDFLSLAKSYYETMGLDISDILANSDNYERPNKNQHAFCINMDRKKDIRTLNNLKPTNKWLETLLHELGHAAYEKGYDDKLPWLLREPPHMITTEAMALISGRQAYRKEFFSLFAHVTNDKIFDEVEKSAKRRQLIFSRWVLVMTYFEEELYKNPDQDLNTFWWKLVKEYQQIPQPLDRKGFCDWAAKYHIGLAPVYYYSYLLGEFFASSMDKYLYSEGKKNFYDKASGEFFSKKLFFPGNKYPWNVLVEKVINKPFTYVDWLEQYAK